MAARLSRGDCFPDGSPGLLGDTIILSSEDDPGDTIRPRLDALGADVSRIHILQGERSSDGKTAGMTLEKLTAFLSAINQIRERGHDVKLLIIDPLNGFMGDGDSNSNEDTRKAADAICSLAEREAFAIVGIMHLNKGKGPPMTRVLGSMAWVAKARAAYIYTKDKETDRRLFLPLKNNLGPDVGGLQYSIQVRALYDGGIEAPYISWEGTANDDIGDILCAPNRSNRERPTPEQDEIENLLREAAPRPMPTGELAEKLGKSPQSVSNALGKLKIKGRVVYAQWGQWTVPTQETVTDSNKMLPSVTAVTSDRNVSETDNSDIGQGNETLPGVTVTTPDLFQNDPPLTIPPKYRPKYDFVFADMKKKGFSDEEADRRALEHVNQLYKAVGQ